MKTKHNGIILLNKPLGLSSNAALQRVKKLTQATKAGHTGTLDPLATGMLAICLDEATKYSQYLLDANKTYHCVAQLGTMTSTGDAEGEVIQEKPVPQLTHHDVERVLQQFVGDIQQIPPMYSAIKHQGQPLYKLARQGIDVERKVRVVNIQWIRLTDFLNDTITFDVECSKGTYIRTLAEDIGHALGCGAHVLALHRTGLGHYTSEQMVSLEGDLLAHLIPLDDALSAFPAIVLEASQALRINQGQQLNEPDLLAGFTGLVRLYASENQFLGLGQINEHTLIAKRMMQNLLP